MSELKAISGNEIRDDIDYNTRGIDPEDKEWCEYGMELCNTMYYIKSEADRYIAELQSANQLEIDEWYNKLMHQKYKRCVAMAKWCEAKVYNIRRKPLCDMDDHEGWQHDDEFWQRWHNRWLELAEHYKEMAK